MSKMSKTIAILGVVAGLGVAALPLSSYAAPVEWAEGGNTGAPAATEGAYGQDNDGNHWVKKDTAVTLTIEDALSIDTSLDTVNLTEGDHTGSVDVTVITNNSKGYNLAIRGSAKTNPTSLTNTPGDEIKAGSGTFDAPAALVNTTDSQWGYSVVGVAAFTDGLYAGVTNGDVTIYNQDLPTAANGQKTTVNFAASLKDGQAAGIYEGQVTFTATNKANA